MSPFNVVDMLPLFIINSIHYPHQSPQRYQFTPKNNFLSTNYQIVTDKCDSSLDIVKLNLGKD